ncbi:thermonuclease family protein [Piscinibacter sp.]|uniref:thermonuclease family protein n=1 Tax=Piscinibacter sp. TaxID=1903157 RepID=UPI0039E46E17
MRAALALTLALLAAPQAHSMTGVVTHVSDGDTIWVRPDDAPPQRKPLKLRLVGIDAPERCQPGGAEATAALKARVLHRHVAVPTHGVDVHGRVLGGLFLDDGSDVAAWMVESGHAWSARWRGRPGPYAAQEQAARERGAGLFADARALEPSRFRKAHGPCDAPARLRSSSSSD